MPHPDSPAGQHTDWQTALARIQIEERIVSGLKEIDRAASATVVTRLAKPFLGQRCFDLGVAYGIAENGAGVASAVAGLSKTFILAAFYDAAHAPRGMGLLSPVYLDAKLLDWAFGAQLKAAHDERDLIVRELGKAITHPAELLANVSEGIAREYKAKWARLQQSMDQPNLVANFEAGRVFGEVLVDVLLLIGTVADVIKVAKVFAEIPELVRLGKGLKSISGVAGAAAKEEAAAGPISRSLRESNRAKRFAEVPEPEPAPPPEKPPLAETPKPILKNVSAAQVELAAAAGQSDAQMAARKAVAKAFYSEYGLDEDAAKSHMKGIDWTKPVKARFTPPPKDVVQWQPKGLQGRYFGSVEEGPLPTQLGTGEDGMEAGKVVPKVRSLCGIKEDTPVLESTAAKMDDDWSVPGRVQPTIGGATQYFVPDQSYVSFPGK